jgi:hypothetical protein
MSRQFRISPICICTPRNDADPVISVAFIAQPAMKPSFTARRAHPWKVNRGRKPEAIMKLLADSAS